MNPSETKVTTDVTDKGTEPAEAAEPVEPVAAKPEEQADEQADEKADEKADEQAVTAEHDAEGAETADAETDDVTGPDEAPRASSGLGTAAAAVVSAGLGIVALSGSWVGRVAAERQNLAGQIETSQGGTPADQISAIYGDAWHSTAMVNGIFALVALIVGLAVLVLPQKTGWVRAVGVAGAVLGVLGLIVSAGMYFDLFLSLPSAPAAPAPGS